MDSAVPTLEVGFAIDTGGSFESLVQLQSAMDTAEAKVVADAARIERATGGMVDVKAAVAGITSFGNAATRELQTAAREMARVEKAGESMVRQLERQGAAFGLTRSELRGMKAEAAALAAEQQGLTDLARRIRAAESDLFSKEYAAARKAAMEAEAAAEDRAMADAREAQAAAEQRAAAEAAVNAQLLERGRLQAAIERNTGAGRMAAADGGASFSALAAQAAAEDERAAVAARRLAQEQADLAAAVRGSAAAQEADAVAAERLRLATDPLYAASKRLNEQIEESTRLYRSGMTAPEEYARQQQVLQERLRQVTNAQDSAAAGAGKHGFALTQLSFQLNDVVTMAGSGADALQILATQGGQIFQVFQTAEGGAAGLAKEVGGLLLRFAPIIGVTAIVLLGAAAWLEYSNAIEKFNALAKGQGRVLGLTGQQLEDNAVAAANAADITVSAAREIESAYVSAGGVVAGVMVDLIAVTKDFAAATGQEATDAAKELGEAFGDPIEGAQQLADKYGVVSQATIEYIGQLVEQGDMLAAQKVLLNALEPAFDGAADHANILARGWDNIRTAAAGAWEWMGKAIDRVVSGGPILDQIADLERQRATYAQAGVTDLSIFDKQLASLRQQLRVQEVLTARSQANAKQQAAAGVLDQYTGGNVLAGYQKAAGTLRAALATDMPRDQRAQLTEALNAYTHAIDTFIPRQDKANQLAALDANIAAAKQPAVKAALAAERERLQLAGEVITSENAEARAASKAAEAKARTHQASNRHAEQLAREAKAVEAQIRNLYALADAYGVSGADALIAEARVKAESQAIKQRGDVDAAVARQVSLVIAQRVADASKSTAAMEDQARIQAQVNGEVAAGNVPAALANELVRNRIADLPLVIALEAARRVGNKKAAEEAEDALERQRAAQVRLTDEQRKAQLDSVKATGSDRLAELREELRLLGETEAVRVRALAVLRATQEATRSGFTGPAAAEYVQQQVDIAEAQYQVGVATNQLNQDLRITAERADEVADAMSRAFGRVGSAIGDAISILGHYGEQQERIDALVKAGTYTQAQGAKKSADLQMNSLIGITGAAKNLFNEHSKGYKAMAAAEKALTIIQLARTAVDVAGGAARMFAELGPFAFPAVAAMLGVMASLGFGGGGSSKPAPTNTGTGTVLGDSEAKSESIKRAIDSLKEVDTLTNTYAREMAASLRSIESQIGNVAALVVRAGDINASGGVKEGFNSNAGTVLSILGGGVGYLLTKIPIIGGILKSLFGTKTTVMASGLYGDPQSLGSILSGGFDASYYSDVQKKKKFFGLTYSTKYRTQFADADAGLESQFTLILRSFSDAIKASAGPLGEATGTIEARLSSFVVSIGKIDLKDLTGEEIQEKLTAVFGAAADQMAAAAFPGIERFQKVGEGAFETLVRVASTVEAVTNSLGMLGTAAQNLSIDAKLGLADLFDDVGDLTSAVSGYFERYYSAAEQAAARTAQMTRVFDSLGLTMPSSLASFRALVEAQNLTTEAGRQTYATLLQLAPAFADLQQSMNGARSAADILSERQDLERKLLELQGNTAALRALDLAKLDASNRALQQQIWALQDAQEAAKAADELRKAWTDIGTSIMDEVKRIRGLTDPTGDGSFAALMGQFNAATSAARAGDQDAAKSLPGLSQALLKAAQDAATSRQELERVQAQTAASLEATFAAISALGTPSSASTADALLAAMAASQSASSAATAANDDMASELAALRQEIAGMRSENNAGHAANASANNRTAKVLEGVSAESAGQAISVASAAA
jgi:hypothetical protein